MRCTITRLCEEIAWIHCFSDICDKRSFAEASSAQSRGNRQIYRERENTGALLDSVRAMKQERVIDFGEVTGY